MTRKDKLEGIAILIVSLVLSIGITLLIVPLLWVG